MHTFLDLIHNLGTGLHYIGLEADKLYKFVSKKLPKEYQKVDYIESSGTQYIDTDIIPNQNTKVETKFNCSAKTGLYCSTGDATLNSNYATYISADGGRCRFNGTSTVVVFSYNADHVMIQDKTGVRYDNTLYPYSPAPSDFTSTTALKLGYHVTANFKGRVYYTKIYDNNNLVRNLVPAVKKASKNLLCESATTTYT